MNLEARVSKLEAATANDHRAPRHDLTLLTDEELQALIDCHTDAGEVIEERVTPELEAALRRVER